MWTYVEVGARRDGDLLEVPVGRVVAHRALVPAHKTKMYSASASQRIQDEGVIKFSLSLMAQAQGGERMRLWMASARTRAWRSVQAPCPPAHGRRGGRHT